LNHRAEILTVAAMGRADRHAMANGRTGGALMDAAGAGLADAIARRWSARRVAVLCGPGNNGGDGWEAAARLKRAGWSVEVFSMVDRSELTGDSARAAAKWDGAADSLEACDPAAFGLFIDALFGAGLSLPLEGELVRLA
jgi:Uncharacterized conserved protein